MAGGSEGLSSTIKVVLYVAEDLADSWRELGQALGLEESVLDTIEYEYGADASQCLLATVECWHRRSVSGEPLAEFETALRKLQREDLVEDLHLLTGHSIIVSHVYMSLHCTCIITQHV